MSSRIYKVTVVSGGGDEHLVKAVSPGRAQLYVAGKFINARIASATDVANLMGKGKKVEDATNPPAEPPPSAPELPIGDSLETSGEQ